MTVPTSVASGTKTWPTLAGLALLWAATLANQTWILGVLFLGWAAWDITTGESFFLQRIRRASNPVVFWAVEVSWIGFGLLWMFQPT